MMGFGRVSEEACNVRLERFESFEYIASDEP